MISNQEREEVSKRWEAEVGKILEEERDDIDSIKSRHAARGTIRSGMFVQELLERCIKTVEKLAEIRNGAWINTLSKRTKAISPEDKQEILLDVKRIILSQCETVTQEVIKGAKVLLGHKSKQLEEWERKAQEKCSGLLTRFMNEIECKIIDLNSSIQEKRRWKRTEKISLAAAVASIIATAVSIISLILSLKAFYK